MTSDQRQGWGWGAIILGGVVLLCAANQSSRNEHRAAESDAWINREIDHRNNWQPGSTDKFYPPGTGHRYNQRETPVGLMLIGVALIAAGIYVLNQGKSNSVPKQ